MFFVCLKSCLGSVWSLVLSRVIYVFRSFCAHRKIAFSQTIFQSLEIDLHICRLYAKIHRFFA
ncbi:hypothetical protein HMPREF9441_01766 [Paraprevotella clara YIT 11840]|uniref:Uncharacterized protein n=1 Tax=Paraprevotella clara YIT 11840 TaxID=762968 RepID=G5SQX6_9BACT|nr:hypothetical protein HMPREF9441_01766 [Paraprevotella clara YIT 11840]